MVYPRGCGATFHLLIRQEVNEGLSPRVRGYPPVAFRPVLPVGSIPAGAGLPVGRSLRMIFTWVYPRGCGATKVGHRHRANIQGLSPRVRGYRVFGDLGQHAARSIPAGAGLPLPATSGATRTRVYPRGCGATKNVTGENVSFIGLSPRVRGYPCYSLSGPGRYGPVAPCIAPKTRQSVAGGSMRGGLQRRLPRSKHRGHSGKPQCQRANSPLSLNLCQELHRQRGVVFVDLRLLHLCLLQELLYVMGLREVAVREPQALVLDELLLRPA